MYAIFEAKGKQFRAEPDATLRLPTLDAQPGDRVTFDQVLLAGRDDDVFVGQPSLDGAVVAAEVIRHGRGEKIIVYKMKRRKGYRRKQGHRQGFTEVRVLDIEIGSGKSAAPKAEVKKTAPKKAAPKKAAPAKAEAKPKAVEAVAEEVVETPAPQPAAGFDVTDSARELAEEAGIDLASIEGTGKEGRILKSDVQKAIKERDEA
ncbi:MAG: 50S ribosomal protein L21 [Candidatus Palauibacterales bacterium]|nr:50S ribosomal protein L21 [Candidatus Palauibacterales bacterium]